MPPANWAATASVRECTPTFSSTESFVRLPRRLASSKSRRSILATAAEILLSMLQERLSTLSDFRPIDTRAPPADGPVLSHVSAAFESFDFSFWTLSDTAAMAHCAATFGSLDRSWGEGAGSRTNTLGRSRARSESREKKNILHLGAGLYLDDAAAAARLRGAVGLRQGSDDRPVADAQRSCRSRAAPSARRAGRNAG